MGLLKRLRLDEALRVCVESVRVTIARGSATFSCDNSIKLLSQKHDSK